MLGFGSRLSHGRSRSQSRSMIGLFVLVMLFACAQFAAPVAAREKRTTPATNVDAALETPAPAPAALPPPPPPDAPMRAHYDYARQMFAKEQYVAAAEAMERAFAQEPKPMLMFNIGQAYRKAARYSEATRAYQRFVEMAPDHPMAADARDHLRTISILNTQEEKRKQIELDFEQSQQEIARMRKTPIYKRAWFWASVAGVVATAVAIGVGVKAYQDQRASDSGLLTLQF